MHAREERTLNYSRDELVATLKKNLAAHIVIVTEARESFKAQLMAALGALKEKVSSTSVDGILGDFSKFSVVRLKPVVDYREEYEEVIALFERAEDELVQLTANEFKTYFLNKWHWQADFLHRNSAYSATAARMR